MSATWQWTYRRVWACPGLLPPCQTCRAAVPPVALAVPPWWEHFPPHTRGPLAAWAAASASHPPPSSPLGSWQPSPLGWCWGRSHGCGGDCGGGGGTAVDLLPPHPHTAMTANKEKHTYISCTSMHQAVPPDYVRHPVVIAHLFVVFRDGASACGSDHCASC